MPQPLCFGAVVALHSGGAFPGSRICSLKEDPWEHAIIEAWRHLKIFENLANRTEIYPFLASRLKHFGTHQSEAIAAVNKGTCKEWPIPKMELLVELRHFHSDGYSLFRALCKDYLPWHLGDCTRFIF